MPLVADELKDIRRLLALQGLSELQEQFRELISSFREDPQRAVAQGRTSQVKVVRHTISFYALIILAIVSVSTIGPYMRFYVIFLACTVFNTHERPHPTVKVFRQFYISRIGNRFS